VIGRLARISGGYLAACVTIGFVVALELLLWFLIQQPQAGSSLPYTGPAFRAADARDAAYSLLQVTAVVSIFAAMWARVPAVIAIPLAEARGLRSAALYGGAGLVAAAAASRIFFGGSFMSVLEMPQRWAETIPILIAGIAGLIGGLVYWRIAGRTADSWRVPQNGPL